MLWSGVAFGEGWPWLWRWPWTPKCRRKQRSSLRFGGTLSEQARVACQLEEAYMQIGGHHPAHPATSTGDTSAEIAEKVNHLLELGWDDLLESLGEISHQICEGRLEFF